MHPLIVFCCFLVFAVCVSLGDIRLSVAGLLMLVGVWSVLRCKPSPRAWQMLRRMKIFFASIVLLYTWFTPGRLLLPELDTWSPTWEGVMSGSERVMALVVLVLAVDSFLLLLPREKILAALYFFFYPLHVLGFDRQRFMLRTLLTLEAVQANRPILADKSAGSEHGFSHYLDRLAASIAGLLRESENLALHRQCTVDVGEPPPGWQYAIPLSLAMVFSGVAAW